MCLHAVPFSKESMEKMKEHMEKVHSAKCPIKNLVELCQEAEEMKERDRFYEIIKEEREEQSKKEIKALSGLFRKKSIESANKDTKIINCFLCQETWTGGDKKHFEKHLVTYHGLIFGFKEIFKTGNDYLDDNSEEETYV